MAKIRKMSKKRKVSKECEENHRLFWRIGHKYTGHKLKGSPNIGITKFRMFYAVSPFICSEIWKQIKPHGDAGIEPKHLLWTLHYLKTYESETKYEVLKSSEKTIRKWIWHVMKLIAELDVVRYENRFLNAEKDQKCFTSLDTIDFKMSDKALTGLRDSTDNYYSEVYKSQGIRYEVGIAVKTGDIVWKYGGLPCGSYPEINLANEAYIYAVKKDELTYANKKYHKSKFFITPNHTNVKEHKKIMQRHKNLKKKIKYFEILNKPYRHIIDKHHLCFHAIVNIIQITIKHDTPLIEEAEADCVDNSEGKETDASESDLNEPKVEEMEED